MAIRTNTITNIVRYLAIALVGSAGLAGIISSGGGGGGGADSTTPRRVTIASLVEGFCKDRMDGLGEESVVVEIFGRRATPQDVTVVMPQQTALPAGELVASTRTDGRGFYRFEAVPANETYFLTYAKDGFLDEAYFEVTVEADTPKTLEPVPLLGTQFDTFFGFISGTVKNARTGLVLPGVAIRLRGGINNRTGLVSQQATTNTDGSYTVGPLDGGSYTLEASLPGFQTAYFDALVAHLGGDSLTDETIVGTVNLVPNELAGLSFSVSGNVFAAYNPDVLRDTGVAPEAGPFPLAAASTRLRAGIHTTVGSAMAEGFTNADGLYSLGDVSAGQYTLEGTLSGFNTRFIDIAMASNLDNQNVTLMPVIDQPRQITTVLTWGTTTDLDGQLFETEPGEMLVRGFNNDTDGFGPETTLLEVDNQTNTKRYEYFVRDFNRTPLSGSKAQVHVYRGNNLMFTFDLPLNDPDAATAVEWHVFTIDRDSITPVNDLVRRVVIFHAQG